MDQGSSCHAAALCTAPLWNRALLSPPAHSAVSLWLLRLPPSHRPLAVWRGLTTCLLLTGKSCTTWAWSTWPCSSTPPPSTSSAPPSTWTHGWGSSTCCWQVPLQRGRNQVWSSLQRFQCVNHRPLLPDSGSDQPGRRGERHQSLRAGRDHGWVSSFYGFFPQTWSDSPLALLVCFMFPVVPVPTLWSTSTLPSSSTTMVRKREPWLSTRRWRGRSTHCETATATLNSTLRFLSSSIAKDNRLALCGWDGISLSPLSS